MLLLSVLKVAVQNISKHPTQNADRSAKLTTYRLLVVCIELLVKKESQSYPSMALSYHEVCKNWKHKTAAYC